MRNRNHTMQNGNRRKRKAAEAFSKKSEILFAANKKRKAYKLGKRAIKKLEKIPKNYWRYADRRTLTTYKTNLGVQDVSQGKNYKWFTAAIEILATIPERRRTAEDWRTLSLLSNDVGLACDVPEDAQWYTRAILQLGCARGVEWKTQDYYTLGVYYYNLSVTATSADRKLKFMLKAIDSHLKIPAQDRTKDIWKILAEEQIDVGVMYRRKMDWKNASQYLQSALNAKAINYADISRIYLNLELMVISSLLDAKIFALYKILFTPALTSLSSIQKQLNKVYYAVLREPGHNQHNLLQLLKLLRLVDKYGEHDDFPNPILTGWLTDKNAAVEFKSLLHMLERAYQPPTLKNLLEQGQSVTMALTMKMVGLERRVN